MLNIKVNRKDFLKGLQIVENAVSENKIRPVISGIFIETLLVELRSYTSRKSM